MPEVESFFHYRNVDVSSIKELIKRWNPELFEGYKKQGDHRAMADVLESIKELRYYKENFFV
jgi:oligoribonuclease